ncbi:hypothetical protein F4819DRAFT_197732 [Hypoxylon fuscum]|nr:hypothetical protein F4819DRAFT_197732 [Hypoxylon fuscum]
MATIAAVVNKAVADDKSVLLFYRAQSGQLGLSLQSGTGQEDQPAGTWETGSDDYEGYIMSPSHMAATYYRGVHLVAAVTMPKLAEGEEEVDHRNISLVSPVYQTLTTTTLDFNRIAMCAKPDGDEGWLYYYDGTNPDQRTLKEFSLMTGTSTTYDQVFSVKPSSSLAAWYNPDMKTRHVVFQGSSITEYVVGDTQIIPIVAAYKASIPIAAVYSSVTKKAYVYYINANNAIQRIPKGGSTWMTPEMYTVNAPPIAEGSQLTVVNANGYNHLFYVPKDSGSSNGTKAASFSSFTHFVDEIS